MRIGIDAGGTLIKIVTEHQGKREYQTFLTTEIEQVAQSLNDKKCSDISITGGNAKALNDLLHCEPKHFIEFDAADKGVDILLKEQGIELDRYIFTNVGTGTSIHLADHQGQERVGGIGTGGGMIQGLGYLLTEIKDYQKLTDLAQQGNRDIIDLKVKHIYKNDTPPISGELTASNFGHVLLNLDKTFTDADKLASLIGVVGESVTTVSIHVAREHGAKDVVYIGSSFHNNPLLQQVVTDYTILRGFTPHYLNNGAFSGALGTLYL
ncbi:type II pantothenate kinase [Staphylococcus chromogenes]|uniref:type II pantothenate kinase n=1 Tax=Staphylococcus chromogenes TaxID=46126 RepID=UPI000D1A878B|nr:type II pantothenate kinase [Staphylococcus chromogenes]PTG07339.1 type II pantothenate kinase [Staphylococcus chromogenes]PTG16956.1 type II pantothenate kinase [Staphylococcus chromogenes]